MFGAQYQQPFNPMQPGQFQNPYLERFNAMTQQPQPQVQPLQHYEIIQVNGENGARAFRMAPNSRCLLLDETNPIVWLVQSDGAGYQTLTPYSITPYQAEPAAVPGADLDERLSKLEAIIYGQPNTADAKPTGKRKSSADAPAE